MSSIQIKDLVVGYDHQPAASVGTFTVSKGEYVCIVGENGSGKTTFMKTLLGLLKPVSGTVEFNGICPDEIGWLSQQTAVQKNFPASVREVVLSGFAGKLGYRFFYTKQEKQQAENNMKLTGCIAYQDQCFRELSGGQAQRALLARALCAADGYLLMDEPMAGLDPQAQNTFYQCIEALHEKGMTILMITHDHRSLQYADQVLSFAQEVKIMAAHEYLKKVKNVG